MSEPVTAWQNLSAQDALTIVKRSVAKPDADLSPFEHALTRLVLEYEGRGRLIAAMHAASTEQVEAIEALSQLLTKVTDTWATMVGKSLSTSVESDGKGVKP